MKVNDGSSTENQLGQTYRVIGTRPVRPGDAAKVTGQAIYGEDIHMAEMLYGAVLRSPHAHARIVAIDTRPAEALALPSTGTIIPIKSAITLITTSNSTSVKPLLLTII